MPKIIHASMSRTQFERWTRWRTLFAELRASKVIGPTRDTESLPRNGNKVAHWIYFELQGVLSGLINIR